MRFRGFSRRTGTKIEGAWPGECRKCESVGVDLLLGSREKFMNVVLVKEADQQQCTNACPKSITVSQRGQRQSSHFDQRPVFYGVDYE
jgi:hypothetical protein